MEKLNKFLDAFYRKIPGSYWGILGGFFGLAVFLIAVGLHSLTEPYSMLEDPVSALGWGPNGSEPVFRIGLLVLGALLAPYILFLTRFLWAKSGESQVKVRNLLNLFGISTAIIAVIGLYLVSIFGNIKQEDFFWHLIGAFMYFIFALVFVSLFTISMVLGGKINKIQIIISIVAVGCAISLIIAIVPVVTESSGIGLVFDFQNTTYKERLTLLAEFQNVTKFFAITEWLDVMSICGWFAVTAFSTLKFERESK